MKKTIVGAVVGAVIAIATVQDIKHKGLFYQALPTSLRVGLDDVCKSLSKK